MKNGIVVKEVELQKALKVIGKIPPGFIHEGLFQETCRLTVAVTVDIVLLRFRDSKLEVLLVKRPSDDPVFAGKFHVPGSIIRPTDKKGALDDVFRRILDGELEGIKVKKEPVFVRVSFHENDRGSELSVIHWVEVEDCGAVGEFFDVENLPDNFLSHQIPLVKWAVEDFMNRSIE